MQTSDGGYAITGESGAVGSESVLVAKFDGNGNPQWQQTYRDTTDSSGSSIQQASDGGYVVGGTDNQRTGADQALLLKLSSSGAVQFQDAFTPGPIGNNTTGSGVVQAPDGGYVLAGSFNFRTANGPKEAAWLVKVTSAGALSWQHIYTTSPSGLFQSVRTTSDGGYIAAGTADPFSSSDNVWLVKTDANGDVASGTCKAEQPSATGTSAGALTATATSFPSVTPAGTSPAATTDAPVAANLVTQTVC